MAKKITLATVKRFIAKHGAALQIATLSRFSGMTDGVESCADRGFSPVTTPIVCDKPFRPAAGEPDHYLGIAGAWFVFQSRDHFSEYAEGGFVGIKVVNCCGSFVLAVPAPMSEVLGQIAEAVTHPAKQPRAWPTTKQEDAEARQAAAIGKAFDLAMQPTPAGAALNLFLVTMKGGFLGFNSKLVAEYPDALKFASATAATRAAAIAAPKLGLTQANWEVMSTKAYDAGGK